jgi:hypothetical protein
MKRALEGWSDASDWSPLPDQKMARLGRGSDFSSVSACRQLSYWITLRVDQSATPADGEKIVFTLHLPSIVSK